MLVNYELHQVFGDWRDADSPTYVDRAKLDSRLSYLLRSSTLIVIHGESRQGKTILRRKHLEDDSEITISCSLGTTASQIKRNILRKIGTKIISETQQTDTKEIGGEGQVEGQAGIPIIASAKLSGKFSGSATAENSQTFQPISDPEDINFIIDELRRDGRRVVIEDFHYISDDQQRQLAFDLKAFGDNSINVMIIGVWAEANRLTTFNAQLRAEELSIQWTDAELHEVLNKGEKALNIEISQQIKDSVIADAEGNVGLLQLIAAQLCQVVDIYRTQAQTTRLNELSILEAARRAICQSQLQARFSNALSMISKGINNTESRTYEKIVRACAEVFTDDELIQGVKSGHINRAIRRFDPTFNNQSNITQRLDYVNALQAERGIMPPIFTYDSGSRELRLIDRTFLFYRKYRTAPYPWEEIE